MIIQVKIQESRIFGLWIIFIVTFLGSGVGHVFAQDTLRYSGNTLSMHDKDPFDYAMATRIIPSSTVLKAEFTVQPEQNKHGQLQIEFQDSKGRPAVQLLFDSDGFFKTRAGYRMNNLIPYQPGKCYHVEVVLNTTTRFYQIKVDGKELGPKLFFAPVDAFERVVFRTGTQRYFPNPDTPTDQDYDLENPGKEVPEALFYVRSLITNNNNDEEKRK